RDGKSADRSAELRTPPQILWRSSKVWASPNRQLRLESNDADGYEAAPRGAKICKATAMGSCHRHHHTYGRRISHSGHREDATGSLGKTLGYVLRLGCSTRRQLLGLQAATPSP